MTKPKSNYVSGREIKAVLRLEAEALEIHVPALNYTAQLIRQHQAMCLRAAMRAISVRKLYKK